MPKTTTKVKSKAKAKAKTEEEEVKIVSHKGKYFHASGKRKTSIARVRLHKGTGEILVNKKAVNEYFVLKTHLEIIKSPLALTGNLQKFDITAIISGGGINSQAEALRHGISKALVESDPLNKPTLKKAGMITRDSRVKERKKFGLKRARKAPQFSKR